jgi:hypothetical protein
MASEQQSSGEKVAHYPGLDCKGIESKCGVHELALQLKSQALRGSNRHIMTVKSAYLIRNSRPTTLAQGMFELWQRKE